MLIFLLKFRKTQSEQYKIVLHARICVFFAEMTILLITLLG